MRDFPEDVRKRYVGNEVAVKAVHKSMRRVAAGMQSPERPAGAFLFVGPSGVGKTYLAKLTAKMLLGKDKYIEFAMNQYREGPSLNNLLGAWGGYVGHDKGATLIKWIQDKPRSVVNFDEIEKAHIDVKSAFEVS